MLSFRPHTLQASTQSAGSVASNGDYTEGTLTWGKTYPCLAVGKGKANIIIHDGEQYSYSYEIHLDSNTPTFAFGDMVRLYLNRTLLGEYRVLGFQRNQLNCLLWV